jgi:hypothetical protein
VKTHLNDLVHLVAPASRTFRKLPVRGRLPQRHPLRPKTSNVSRSEGTVRTRPVLCGRTSKNPSADVAFDVGAEKDSRCSASGQPRTCALCRTYPRTEQVHRRKGMRHRPRFPTPVRCRAGTQEANQQSEGARALQRKIAPMRRIKAVRVLMRAQ